MDLEIRNAKMEDCRYLGRIHVESWKVAYKGVVPDEFLERLTIENSEKRFINAISQGLEKNIVAVKNNQIVGFTCIGKCRDSDVDCTYGEIWGIYLLPSCWRQGIGTKLLLHDLTLLKNEGFYKASLWVLEDNINARKFYEKFGFEYDGTKKELNFGNVINEIRYKRDL